MKFRPCLKRELTVAEEDPKCLSWALGPPGVLGAPSLRGLPSKWGSPRGRQSQGSSRPPFTPG
eukprot:1133173-Alexandrium_andersonii.AAC.1